LALDTVQQALICAGVWNYLVTRFGDFANLAILHKPLIVGTIFKTTVAAVVQIFLTHRIWKYDHKIWPIVALLIPSAISQPVVNIVYIYKTLTVTTVAGLEEVQRLTQFINGMAAAVDMIIAICMVVLLIRGQTGFNKSTDRVIGRLIVVTVNTGLWTGVVALLIVILSTAYPNDIYYAWPSYVLSPLYCNTLLANLNSRKYIRSGQPGLATTGGGSQSLQPPPVVFGPNGMRPSTSTSGRLTDVYNIGADKTSEDLERGNSSLPSLKY